MVSGVIWRAKRLQRCSLVAPPSRLLMWGGALARQSDTCIGTATPGKRRVRTLPDSTLDFCATELLLERYVNGLAVFRRQRHFLILLAKLLLHKRKRVVAWRQAFNFVFTVRSRNREKRVLHHAHVHLHPRMLIALHRKHDFFAGEALLQRCRVWRL